MPDDVTYSSERVGKNRFKIWQHIKGSFGRVICEMAVEDVLKLYESVVPDYQEEVFVKGNPNCVHAWQPYGLNDKFKLCRHCDAILKIKRLVPRVFE